jgi:nucleoside-diphosphate-sugar epimerase
MKVAVTGASGFIGRNFLKELSKFDVDIVAVSKSSLVSNNHLSDRIQWLHIDLHKPSEGLYEALGCPDVLVHLAWSGLPNYKSLHHFQEELPAHYKFLEGLVRDGLNNLIVMGTCFEYGMKCGALPSDERTDPCNPYAFAKDVLHKQLKYLKDSHFFNLTWARLFYVYGEDQSKASLFGSLKDTVERGEQSFDMSGGEQLRDYLSVQEVSEKLRRYVLAPSNYGAVNICSGKPISVRRLVESWVKDYQWDIEINLHKRSYADYEPMAFWGVPSKI